MLAGPLGGRGAKRSRSPPATDALAELGAGFGSGRTRGDKSGCQSGHRGRGPRGAGLYGRRRRLWARPRTGPSRLRPAGEFARCRWGKARPKQPYRLLPAIPDRRASEWGHGQAAHLHNPLEAEVGLLGAEFMARADRVIGQGDRIAGGCGQVLGRPSVEVEGVGG